jgi:anti-anti-sigma regulatory factor
VAADGDPVVVDGSAVERIDTAGLQLLVAFARRQKEAGRRLHWEAASPALLSGSARLGLNEALGLGALAREVKP